MSEKQVQVLDHLDEVNAMSLTLLARHMGVTLATMSITIDRLVRRGLVRRAPDPVDKRRVMLRLTEAGARVTEAHSVLDPLLVDRLVGSLDESTRARALEGLNLLAEAASRMAKGRWSDTRTA